MAGLVLLQAAAAGAPAAAISTTTPTTTPSPAPADAGGLRPCRLKGLERQARCGELQRPLDPTRPDGETITVRYAVLPAPARRKAADPVFFLAGGPGQSAMELAGPLVRRLGRLANRRDLVFVDQRGTGSSAPLKCAGDDERQPPLPLADQLDPQRQIARLAECRTALQRLPHGDLRQYTTSIAMADLDAVRAALGAGRINLVGASYGTRAALEYQRQFPPRVRRMVLDGIAPPDMRLPESFAPDGQAALDTLLEACAADAGCRGRHPQLAAQWQRVLSSLPRDVSVQHPLTGHVETLRLERAMLMSLVRGPLYLPALAAGLPAAIAEAEAGRFGALFGLAAALGGGGGLATGMHFSVVCAEDLPAADGAPPAAAAARDFGNAYAELYRRICADWPRGTPPAGFRQLAPTAVPVLLLSGGADPATPPRHGERVARALGARARHVVVAAAGHGVLQLACVREAAMRFIEASDDAAALALDLGCAAGVPRPPDFIPIGRAQPAADTPAAAASQGAR